MLKLKPTYKKIESPWSGPYIVTKVVSPVVFQIENKRRKENIHFNKLKPCVLSEYPKKVRPNLCMEEMVKMFSCSKCEFQASARSSAVLQILTKHNSIEAAPFRCALCVYIALSYIQLGSHTKGYKLHLARKDRSPFPIYICRNGICAVICGSDIFTVNLCE